MADKKSVRLEVDPEVHEEWTEFVRESEYSTLSGMIRSAVVREMNTAKKDRPDGDIQAEVDLSPVTDAIYDLEERIAGVEDEMRSLDIASNATSDHIKEMMHYARKYIPLVESEKQLADIDAGVELSPVERAQLSGTVRDVADAIRAEAEKTAEKDNPNEEEYIGRVDVWDVERALERLSREVGRVEVVVTDGDRRYYEVKQ